MTNNKPTHQVKIAGPTKPDGGKSFWTTVGSAWQRDDGTVSINVNEGVQLLLTKQVNEGVQLLLTKQVRIMLAPVEER